MKGQRRLSVIDPADIAGRLALAWILGLVLSIGLAAAVISWDLSYAGTPGNWENEGQLGWILGVPLAVALASVLAGAVVGRGASPLVVALVCPGPWAGAPIAFVNPLAGLVVAVLGTGAGLAGRALRTSLAARTKTEGVCEA